MGILLFIVELFTIAKTWKQHTWPPADARVTLKIAQGAFPGGATLKSGPTHKSTTTPSAMG